MLLARFGSSVVVSFVLVACSHSAPPSPENAPIAEPPVGTVTIAVVDAGSALTTASDASAATAANAASVVASMASPDANDADAGPDYGACTADTDCVAVKKNACCNHGELEAVAASHASDYKASFKCPPPRPMCPMFMRVDRRVAICDAGTQHCAMVAPSDLACGAAAGAHTCPTGLHCGAGNKCTK